jgi:hypothetical protein
MPGNAILEISTVVGCRLACSCCPQATHVRAYRAPKKPKVLSLADYQTCLAKVPRDVMITFAGMAEPWLNPACTEMVVLAHQAGHEVSVFTTGLGLPLADIPRLVPIPFRHFCLHLPDAAGDMKLPVTPLYLETLAELQELIPAYTHMTIGQIHPAVAAIVGPVSDGSSALISRAGNLPDRAIAYKKGPLKCSVCGPVVDHNVLLPDGSVVLCCMDYNLEHILGNLLTVTYEDLFSGEEYQRVIRGLAGDESVSIACRKCELSVAQTTRVDSG